MTRVDAAPAKIPLVVDTYARLIDLLDQSGISYRKIDHEPEGETSRASVLRGHPLSQAAKSLVVRVALTKKSAKYLVAVVPGDRRVRMDALCDIFGGQKAAFASQGMAEKLTGCVSGSIIPFSFSSELPVFVDPTLLGHPEIFFNAARLDCSLAIASTDYLKLARPSVEKIVDLA